MLQNPDPSVQKLAQAVLGQVQLSNGTIDALETLNTGFVQYAQGVAELNQSKVALSEGLKNYVANTAGISQAFSKFSGSFKALPNQYDLLLNGQRKYRYRFCENNTSGNNGGVAIFNHQH